ncbi:MAG: hypothetical protein HC880_00515 [Bacteroidia bacterium]|nr:hypothetical protein [Bacteroidia bacterium]
MPTVPKYNRQVQLDTPNIPSVNIPQAPRAAFGEDVIQANKGIGNVVSGIGKMLQQRQKEKYDLEQDQLETKTYGQYEIAKQDILFNTETENANVNGQDIERPKGILNRKLGQSAGSTEEYYVKANKYAMETLKNIKDPNTKAKLAARFSQDVISTRERVIKHESNEYTSDKINTFASGVQTSLNNAFRVTNENELDIQIENALINQDNLNRIVGVDPQTAQNNLNDILSKVIGNAVTGSFDYDKTGQTARAIVAHVKNNIRKEEEIKLNDLIDKGLSKISKEKTEELANKFLNDELTIDEVMANSRPKEEGGIGAKQAEQFINKIKKHQMSEMANIYENIPDSQKYIDVINSTLLDETDSVKFKKILIDAYSDGTLNKQEKDQLIKLKSILTEKRSRDNHPIMTNIGIIKNFYGVNNRDPRSLAVSIKNF